MSDKMHTNSKLHLPNETLAIIINEIDPEDNQTPGTLASCRLASHVLCALATPLLFASIELADDLADLYDAMNGSALMERVTKLNEILSVSDTGIAASVRTLTLRCYSKNFENPRIATLMSAILRRLPRIRKFTLEAPLVRVRDRLQFSSIPQDLASAILTLCRSPNLTTLYLDDIEYFPFTAIITCPNLRHLRIWNITQFQFDNVNSSDETPSSSTRLLSLDSVETDVHGMNILNSYPSNGTMSIAEYHFPQLKSIQFRHHTTNSLMNLILEFDGFSLDLGRFPDLRYVKIQERSGYCDNEDCLRFLTYLLYMSYSPSNIETLELEITWHGVEFGHGKNLFSSVVEWSSLDRLSTSQMFASLTKIILRLRLEIAKDWTPEMSLGIESVEQIWESERNLTLPYVNDLFPLFRADTQRTVETHFNAINWVPV